MIKSQLLVWILAAIAINGLLDRLNFQHLIIPLFIVSFFAFLISKYRLKNIEYLLFFSISLTSLFGLTETLTGFYAESTNVLLFGLSFYSASMAYLISQNRFGYQSILYVSNPLLLSTGPIALFFRNISHRSLRKRIEYFFPFVIVGTFMFQIVGIPLTEFFFLIDSTDVVSSIIFAAIFEIFVYANFCGLSLLLFGLFGLFGYRIPLNFNQPFSSRNIVEFWRGWHTSLSQVLKVLFYKPLRKKRSLFTALFGVYIASAMWHGVTLNFLLWGLFHAFFFWLSIKFLRRNYSILPILLMPFIIILGRLIFAESDTERLFEKLTFSFNGFDVFIKLLGVPMLSIFSLLFGTTLIAIEFIFKNTKIMRKRNYKFLRIPFSLLFISGVGVLFVSNLGVDYAVYGQR